MEKDFEFGYSDGINIDELLDMDDCEDDDIAYQKYLKDNNLTEEEVRKLFFTPKPRNIFEAMARIDRYEKKNFQTLLNKAME